MCRGFESLTRRTATVSRILPLYGLRYSTDKRYSDYPMGKETGRAGMWTAVQTDVEAMRAKIEQARSDLAEFEIVV